MAGEDLAQGPHLVLAGAGELVQGEVAASARVAGPVVEPLELPEHVGFPVPRTSFKSSIAAIYRYRVRVVVKSDCVVNFDNIHTLPKESFRRKVTSLSALGLAEVFRVLAAATG